MHMIACALWSDGAVFHSSGDCNVPGSLFSAAVQLFWALGAVTMT